MILISRYHIDKRTLPGIDKILGYIIHIEYTEWLTLSYAHVTRHIFFIGKGKLL